MRLLNDYLLWGDFKLRVLPTCHDPKNFSGGTHRHEDFYELVFVKEGKAIHHIENHDMKISTGDIFLVHPGISHGYNVIKEMYIYNIVFSETFLEHFRHELAELPSFQLFFQMHRDIGQGDAKHLDVMHIEKEHFPEIIACLEDICREEEGKQPGAKLAITGNFMRLLLLICRYCKPRSEKMKISHPYKISCLMALLEKQYGDDWTLEKMAECVKIPRSSFRQQFKSLTGDSPIKYLLRLRLKKAALLLTMGELAVSDLAFDCGFTDSNYFSRQFKSEFGMNPREYRRVNRHARS